MKKFQKSLIMGRRKKKVRGNRQWAGRVYAGRNTAAGGYLAFFSVAGTRLLNSYIMRILEDSTEAIFSLFMHYIFHCKNNNYKL